MLVSQLRQPGVPLVGILAALVLSSLLSHNNAHANDIYLNLNERELLEKYARLCAQAVPERIQLMQNLTAAEKSYFWRVHLGLYLAQHSTLTRAQQRIVTETLAIATPQLFAAPELNNPNSRSKLLEPLEDLTRRGLQVFPKTEAAQIFAQLGDTQDAQLIDKYSRFSKLIKGERKARFNKITAQEKSDLWRVHLGLNLARHPEWGEQQRSIVLEAMAMASPELYGTPKDSNWKRLVDEPVRLFSNRARLVFSKQEGAALFSELGDNEPKAHHSQQFAVFGTCTCAQDSDWCTYSCYSTECTILTWGCGTMMLYACNGVCYWPS